jgi:hypothetical protein
MSLVAGIWVKSLTGSSAKAGLVSVCIYAPSLAGPFAGVVADRLNRQRLLIGTNLAMAVVVLALLGVRSGQSVWLVFVVMAVYGVEGVLAAPAEAALFAEMLPLGMRQRMNGWRLGIQETGRICAPLFGAGLFALLGGGAVAALDSLTFVVAAVVTSMLRFRAPPGVESRHDFWHELTAGARHIMGVRELRAVVFAAGGAMALSGLAVPAQYSLVTAIGERPAFLGVLSAALGTGSVIASLSASRVQGRLEDSGLALAGLANFIAGLLLVATGQLVPAIIGAFVSGFALPWVYLAALNASQRLTPVELQGRVSAAVSLALFGPVAPMEALGSLAISETCYRIVYLGLAALALCLVGGSARRFRDVRRGPRAPRARG